MKKWPALSLTVIFICVFLQVGKGSPLIRLDSSGLEMFWRVVSVLEKDLNPSAEQWDSLFRTPGYAILTKSEFKREFFTEKFALVFMPSKAAELNIALDNADDWEKRYLRHYLRVKSLKKSIQAHVRKLDSDPLFRRASQMALSFIPAKGIADYPAVAFLVFEPDARGYSPVVIDALMSMDKGPDLVYLLAHEFHHFFRNQVLVFDPEKADPEDEDILWVINQLQGEGIADQINMRRWMDDGERFKLNEPEYLKLHEKSPEIIRAMDALFAQIDQSPGKKKELGRRIREMLPWSGHPTGFYMANRIRDQLGSETLVRGVGDPFSFFSLYKTAADNSGDNRASLSEATVHIVHTLSNKYVGKYELHGSSASCLNRADEP
jgi:hypothetical protein